MTQKLMTAINQVKVQIISLPLSSQMYHLPHPSPCLTQEQQHPELICVSQSHKHFHQLYPW